MRAFVLGFILGVWPACVASDYAGAMQNCVDQHIGDPQGREQCICQTAADAGRPCPIDGGAE